MRGFWLNQALNDLRRADNRAAFTADREEYLGRYPLTDAQKQLIRDGDWAGVIEEGASVYTLTKLGATIDVSLLQMGAQMRGQSPDEFSDFLREQNKRAAAFALLPAADGGDPHG
jgi:Aromatic-ring-opening dioxygenase LigAB, LigA subunit.